MQKRIKATRTMLQALGVAMMFISSVNVISVSVIVSNGNLQTENEQTNKLHGERG